MLNKVLRASSAQRDSSFQNRLDNTLLSIYEKEGLPATQRVRGLKDHALKGQRKGQRSVYLNRQWRLIYTVNKKGQVHTITVKEVMPHDY